MVFGAGALGSVVGGLLTRRHEVTLVGRPAHVQAIEEGGLVISGAVEAVVVPHAVEDVKGLPLADMVVLTVKAYDTAQALQALRPLVGEGTMVVSLQNGLNNADLLSKAYPLQAVAGVATMGAILVGPGRVLYAGEGEFSFGVIDAEPSLVNKVAEAFGSVGLESRASDDIMTEAWSKAVVNASVNPLTAIARCKNGKVLIDPHLSLIAESACQEATSVARAHEIELDDDEMRARVKEVLLRTSENKSSMLQDMERGKRTEIDEITGEIVRGGAAKGVPTPVNRTLWLLVRSLARHA